MLSSVVGLLTDTAAGSQRCLKIGYFRCHTENSAVLIGSTFSSDVRTVNRNSLMNVPAVSDCIRDREHVTKIKTQELNITLLKVEINYIDSFS